MKKTANTFDSENIEYVKEQLGEDAIETFFRISNIKSNIECHLRSSKEELTTYTYVNNMLSEMEKYGNNRWWISEDKRILAYYAVMCPIVLVKFDRFIPALSFLLDRSIFSHELFLNYEELKKEAERAFNGEPYTEEEKDETIAKGFELLRNL